VRISIKYIICLICLLFVSDLVYGQQRRKKRVRQKPDRESTTFRNAYQDLTARYNGYFNANLIFEQSILQLQQNHKDDFDQIIASDKFEGGEKANSVHPQLDIVIKKASVDIKLHPNSKWVDDCYLLIGQAQYLKGNYGDALENLNYINTRFSEDIRIEDFQRKDKEGSGRKRSYPTVTGGVKGGVKVGNKGVSAEDAKKLLKKKREEQKAKKAAERKEKIKERERENNKKEKERKELAKERENKNKEITKEREEKNKEIAKERAEKKKDKEKEMKEREKEREKERKRMIKEKERVKKMKPADRKAYYAKEKERKAREKAEKEVEEARKAREKEAEEAKEKEEEAIEDIKETEDVEEEIVEAIEEEAPEEEEEELIEKEEKKAPKKVKESSKKSSKKKKKKKKKKRSSIGHKLAYHNALIWTARTYIAQEEPDQAKAILDLAEGNKKFPRKLRKELHATYAQYHLINEDKTQAYASLDEAISWTRGRKNKARYHYMQAQISTENKDYAAAGNSFKKVTKSKADYPVKFNAKMNLAKSRLLAGEYSPEQAKRYLEKMLKDGNNADTQDQIYMAMAEIDIANGDLESAFALLEKAAENSTVNKEQKALVFLKIADLYFDKEEFLQASAYYDSTATYLPKSYPNYDDIASRKDILSELAKHLQTIQVEDSLQRIALLPEAKRNVFLDELIEDLITQARERREANEVNEGGTIVESAGDSGSGGWYFYNQIEKSRGYNLFQAQWGNRPLQDNWRRQTGLVGFTDDSETPVVASSSTTGTDTYIDLAESGVLNRSILLANLPLTDAMMKQSHERIMYAYFQSGIVYKDRLENNEKAIQSFDELLRRYPECEYAVQAHYTLYLLEKANGNTAKANTHKKYVLDNDKKGLYKKLIENPEYESEIAGQNKELMKYYEETYGLYLDGDFDQVLNRAKQANTQFTPNDMEPKFDLLTAFVVGHREAKEQYISALKGVVSKHPSDPVKVKAEEILNVIEGGGKTKPKKAGSKSVFKVDMESTHYFVVAFDGFVNQINQTINGFSDYNDVNNSLDKLSVTQMLLNPENQILLVKTFKTGDKAMEYYNKVMSKKGDLLGMVKGVDYRIFPISKKNFTQFFKTKDAAAYEVFFQENYF